jgi:ATP-binding cassette subfamily B protein
MAFIPSPDHPGAIVARPGEQPARGRIVADRRLARRIVALFRPYRGRLAWIAMAVVIAAAMGVVTPFLTRIAFDNALFVSGGPRLRLLGLIAAGMVAVSLTAALLGVWQTYLTEVLGNRVMAELRNRLFAHLQRMDLAFFTATKTGAIQSRLANDVGGVQTVLTQTASSVLSNLVTVLASVAAMLALSWQLTLVAVVVLPLFVWLQTRVGRVRRRVAGATQSSLSDLTAITQEALSVSGILLAKVFNRQQGEFARYRRENERQIDLQVRQAMTGQSFLALVTAFLSVIPAFVYLAAGLALAHGDALTAGTVVAFTALQNRMVFPLVNLMRVSLDAQTSAALFARIFEYLDLEPAIADRPGALALPADRVRGQIRMDSVSFAYPGSGSAQSRREWALRDLCLTIEPGQLAAVVGPSGAGKTTLSYLVPRLYDVQHGAVLFDGHDVREVCLSDLANLVGMVTQDTYLFHASIRDNLRYAREDATDAQIEQAARAANIHERITAFPEGYDTLVGERGYRLSGGEKQRLAIARVILKDPRVLILDEATSALDSASERLVHSALEQVMQGRTTIAIAHRLSTVLAADVIFVLDAGRLVEQGTHEQLLKVGGLYARLYAEQFGAGRIQARYQDGVLFADGLVLPSTSTTP